MAAMALGGVATLAVLRFTLEIAAAGAYAEVIAIALVVVVGAGSFTAGCALRLWAGRQVKGDRPAGPGT
jgi:hypothetical protein